jgi:hypothetical protein
LFVPLNLLSFLAGITGQLHQVNESILRHHKTEFHRYRRRRGDGLSVVGREGVHSDTRAENPDCIFEHINLIISLYFYFFGVEHVVKGETAAAFAERNTIYRSASFRPLAIFHPEISCFGQGEQQTYQRNAFFTVKS